ncbi:MAG: thioredoxin-dependent thiol peroxidase [Bacteroidetes bacterium]|nr:thioredoxin-dependent thiol peroxidase [Bacteroidota bacterium]
MATPKKLPAKKAVKKAAAKKTTAPKAAPAKAKFVGHSTGLTAGDKAPAFSAPDQNGKVISLESLKGKKVVLYFYPKDNTPSCTNEACSLRDEHLLLGKKNFVVLGVSADNEKSHKKFADKFNLPFSLLADPDMKIIKAYDVWGLKLFMGRIYDGIIRTTFVIDEKGIIEHVIKDVDTKQHAQQILSL